MPPNNTSVESYLAEGCGRCELFQTPACKVHTWAEVLVALRALLSETELQETMKWGSPCYTLEGKNVVSLSALKDAALLSFFKGALLADPEGLLVKPGPNSRHARYLEFLSLEDLEEQREATLALLAAAIEAERQGKQVQGKPEEPMPEELQAALDANQELAAAFAALTPGRRRSYILHVSGAKQSATRVKRAERCAEKIFAGKGFNER